MFYEPISQIHKSHNAPVPYPTQYPIQNRNVHISALWDMKQVHFGVCEFCLSAFFESSRRLMNQVHSLADKILALAWFLSTCHLEQATGLDAWASRVKCPARFVSHLHEICIYIWIVYSLCFFCCLFMTVTWWYVWCFEWANGNQEEVQACLVTLWLFITSCYSLYKTTLGLLCSWFENNPHFHKYSMDFHV